jgi:hypothetical protein
VVGKLGEIGADRDFGQPENAGEVGDAHELTLSHHRKDSVAAQLGRDAFFHRANLTIGYELLSNGYVLLRQWLH